MKTIIAFSLLSLTAFASPLSDKVAELQAAGILSAQEVRVQLCRPGPESFTTNTTTVANVHAEDEAFWAGEIVTWANLATGTTNQTVHTAATIDMKDATLRLRALSKTSAANRDKVIYAADGYRAARDWLVETGRPWPVTAGFGQGQVTTVTVTSEPGPAWWQAAGMAEPPTVYEIMALME